MFLTPKVTRLTAVGDPGRYVAAPGPGQSGNFIIMDEGVNEILGGSMGGSSVTLYVKKGDLIEISSLSQVVMTPA